MAAQSLFLRVLLLLSLLFSSTLSALPTKADLILSVKSWETVRLPILETSRSYLVQNLFSRLVSFDGTGTLTADLAYRWKIDPSKRVFTFFLRPGISFEDGSPLDAASVKRSLETSLERFNPYFSPQVASLEGFSDFIKKRRSEVRGIQVLNPTTLRFTLIRPDPHFFYVLADINFSIFKRGPGGYIGSGPYRILISSPHELLLGLSPRYFIPLPHAPRTITVRPYSRQRTLSANEVCLLEENFDPPQGWERSSRHLQTPSTSVEYLFFNFHRPWGRRSEFRRLIAEEFDIPKVLAEEKLSSSSVYGLLSMGLKYFSLAPFPQSKPGKGPFILKRRPYRPVTVLTTSYRGRERFSKRLLEFLKEKKIPTKLIVQSHEEYVRTVRSGSASNPADLYLITHNPDAGFLPAQAFLQDFLSPQGQYNFGGYSNPKVASSLVRLSSLTDSQKREEVQRILSHIRAEIPLLPLYYPPIHILAGKEVLSFPISSFGFYDFREIRLPNR